MTNPDGKKKNVGGRGLGYIVKGELTFLLVSYKIIMKYHFISIKFVNF